MVELVYNSTISAIPRMFEKVSRSQVQFKFFLVHKHINIYNYIYIYMDTNTDHFTAHLRTSGPEEAIN